ncbi:Cytochrome oxidase Cu insertion factor, SCO1/SenC/PrrC family [Azotobacter beijerinckii]|uniref:Cytochrome oxidase Cu insertion factor, SCO1/SenC/PrrC family n=1 Tax=Azotobacter beijerinckii TaxID=170623 RepID=A0A1H6RXP5_9GAMM|nr:SCO family protein [Azotobacter beijerinckii]SEI60501.1 Cytochrome oxidase Cu insertion factor, SCO1/SenC/PrrC family [Azotobacter beijerinckii]
MKALRGIALALLAASVQAHEGHAPAAGATAQDVKGGIPDARSYFTDTPLLDQDGRERRFYSDVLAGRVVLLNVIYTRCKDACPLITRKLREVRTALGEQAGRVYFVSLSSDPEHDSPEALKAFARQQGADDPNWIFLTGDKANLERVLARLGQLSQSPEAHSTLLIAGDVPNKRWSKIRPDAPPAAIAQRLQLLAEPLVGR